MQDVDTGYNVVERIDIRALVIARNGPSRSSSPFNVAFQPDLGIGPGLLNPTVSPSPFQRDSIAGNGRSSFSSASGGSWPGSPIHGAGSEKTECHPPRPSSLLAFFHQAAVVLLRLAYAFAVHARYGPPSSTTCSRCSRSCVFPGPDFWNETPRSVMNRACCPEASKAG